MASDSIIYQEIDRSTCVPGKPPDYRGVTSSAHLLIPLILYWWNVLRSKEMFHLCTPLSTTSPLQLLFVPTKHHHQPSSKSFFRIAPTLQWPDRVGLCCSVWPPTMHPAGVSSCLGWVCHELLSWSTGLCPLECYLGYQPPLFPDQEEKVSVLLAQGFIHHCCQIWGCTCSALLCISARVKYQAIHHCSKVSNFPSSQPLS